MSTNSYIATTSSRITTIPTVTPAAQLHNRAPPADPRVIQAKVSVQTETLVISPLALFLSVSIIILLIISTLVIYLVQNRQLRLLPRDFDSPVSLMAAVYASEKLKAWGERQHERREMVELGGRWGKKSAVPIDDDVAIGMGYFTGVDGEEHWGIEVVEDYPLLLKKSSEEDSLEAGGEE